jgi:hypothetical protein
VSRAFPPCLARRVACLTRLDCSCSKRLRGSPKPGTVLKDWRVGLKRRPTRQFFRTGAGIGAGGGGAPPIPCQGRHPNGVAAQRGLGPFAGIGARGVAHIQFFASAPTRCGREELYVRTACATFPSPRGVALMQLQALMQLLARLGLGAWDAWLLLCCCFRHFG